MPNAPNDLELWNAIHSILREAKDSLPWGDDPRTIGWDHPDELWKNDAELENIESELIDDIHSLALKFCENREWFKKSKSAVRFLMDQRLTWAISFIRVLAIPSTKIGGAAVWLPDSGGWDVIHWLLTDAYENRFPPSESIPMYYSSPLD